MKSLGERLREATLEAWNGDTDGKPFAQLSSAAQARWDRAAVGFVSRLSYADSEELARAELVDALNDCWLVLTMMVQPDAIRKTDVMLAYSQAVAAEARARAALARVGGDQNTIKPASRPALKVVGDE